MLGNWSFAIYMLQFPLMTIYLWIRLGTEEFLRSKPMSFTGPPLFEHYEGMLVALLIVLISALVFHLYEEPLRRYLLNSSWHEKGAEVASRGWLV